MNEEDMIQARMTQIINEFSALPQMDKFDLTLESLGGGEVKVIIKDQIRKGDWAERVISREEDLSFIGHTFNYPNTFTPNSKMFDLHSVRNAHFNSDGYLIVIHDDSMEQFKVDAKHRKEVTELLKDKLGTKFN